MTAYYNEFKPEAAHMLRQLIKNGLIAPGEVDERSITEVKPDDLIGYKQCHFFAGIGGWSTALRLAGWPDEEPVWTGSCPCQPFSAAGKKKGKEDERHLWPVWFKLISQCRPSTVFGEQVAAAITHGWWDDVANDMEREGYTCGSAVLPACSVGKPHKRDRLWFVANATQSGTGGDDRGLWQGTSGVGRRESTTPGNVADTIGQRGCGGDYQRKDAGNANTPSEESQLEWIDCPDGKSRPVKPGVCLLANGIQHRTPILHAFGNAIVPQVAAAFIEAAEFARWQRLGLDLV